jgi:hypothetical protein
MDFLTKYKYIFGRPGEGVHTYRLLDVAAVDYGLTIAGAIILSWTTRLPLVLSTILLFGISLILPWTFGLKTSAVEYLSAILG